MNYNGAKLTKDYNNLNVKCTKIKDNAGIIFSSSSPISTSLRLLFMSNKCEKAQGEGKGSVLLLLNGYTGSLVSMVMFVKFGEPSSSSVV